MSSLHPSVPPTHRAALEELLSTYHELNSSFIPRKQGAPTALEFLQHVRRNQPVVFSGAIDHWPAVQRWDAAYLSAKMGDTLIGIAQTPLGNADSVVEYEGRGYFVKPQTTSEPFSSFMEYLQSQPLPATASARIIKYAQSRSYPPAPLPTGALPPSLSIS
jgi:jumonji domain-containing protein 7